MAILHVVKVEMPRLSSVSRFSRFGSIRSQEFGTRHSNTRRIPMKFLHTMIRVNDLDESIKFYCNVLGMKLLGK